MGIKYNKNNIFLYIPVKMSRANVTCMSRLSLTQAKTQHCPMENVMGLAFPG